MTPDHVSSLSSLAVAALPVLPTPSEPVVVASTPALTPALTPVNASNDARRVAGAILEVLAGVRSITDAAVALGIAPARCYVLEARAVAGLITACEPRSPGPHSGSGLAAEVDRLRAERDRLRDEAARYQALARIAQTAFGPMGGAVTAAPATAPVLTQRQLRAARAPAHAPTATTPTAVITKTRKKRVATVRALRLAQRVQQASPGSALPAPMPVATPAAQPSGDRAP